MKTEQQVHDYGEMMVVEQTVAKQAINNAESFILAIEQHLATTGLLNPENNEEE